MDEFESEPTLETAGDNEFVVQLRVLKGTDLSQGIEKAKLTLFLNSNPDNKQELILDGKHLTVLGSTLAVIEQII